jgi:FMN phosphatase YigB (HAD superfamily)
MTAGPCLRGIRAVALDFGGTISGPVDHELREKSVDPDAACALAVLRRELGLRLVLSSNTLPGEARWPALQKAGIDGLFDAALLSWPLGIAKPDPRFYCLVAVAAGCAPDEVLHVGDGLRNDVAAPLESGMRAALVRPAGLAAGEELPAGAVLIRHVRDLAAILGGGA